MDSEGGYFLRVEILVVQYTENSSENRKFDGTGSSIWQMWRDEEKVFTKCETASSLVLQIKIFQEIYQQIRDP